MRLAEPMVGTWEGQGFSTVQDQWCSGGYLPCLVRQCSAGEEVCAAARVACSEGVSIWYGTCPSGMWLKWYEATGQSPLTTQKLESPK